MISQDLECDGGETLTGERLAREHIARKGLTDRLNIVLKACDAVLSSEEEQENGHHDGRDQKTPPRQR